MLRNYLTVAIRNLMKYKGYSFINIAGLAVGLASFILISLFVLHELSYDKWNPLSERIVRTYADIQFGGNHMRMAVTGATVGPDVLRELPEVQAFCRIRDYGSRLVKREGSGQQNINERMVLHADSTFFEVFPLKVIAGDPVSCLKEPNSIALSASRAEKYFGTAEIALGQNLLLDNEERYQVRAVYEDMPSNSHFIANMLVSMNGNREVQQSPPFWAMSNNFHNYLLVRPGVDMDDFYQKFADLSREKIGISSAQFMGMTLEEFEATGQYARFGLQPITDIHLHSDLGVELMPGGNIQYVWIFGAIALFVLLIACINFMNLTTARSAHRSREVGVRKVLGSRRSMLIGQFLCETILMTLIAAVLALGIATMVLPWFNELTERDMSLPWADPALWLVLVLGIGVVGTLAGSYPAFFLSAFDAVKVLKGRLTGKAGGARLRNALVVFQFATSIVLIIATALVYNQLNYIQNKQLGYEKDQVLVVENTFTLGAGTEVYKQEMLKNPAIRSATVSSYLPTPSSRRNTTFSTSREFRQDNAVSIQYWTVDYDYGQTLGLEMEDGRFFDRSFPTDSSGIVINEAAAKFMGFEDDPIGQKMYVVEDIGPDVQFDPEDFIEMTVIGVVKDFHWENLRENIGSLCMILGESRGMISFKVDPAQIGSVIGDLEARWSDMAPDQPFSYYFMDEQFANTYRSERKIGTIAAAFALLAVIISCLGLFGLASFMAEQRTKEIGIRKVLGAHAGDIVGLLSHDFLKLVGIAFVIAVPVGWWGMNQWLQDFAYHVDISWWIFGLAFAVALLIAILSVSYQAVRAALADPVKSLRSE